MTKLGPPDGVSEGKFLNFMRLSRNRTSVKKTLDEHRSRPPANRRLGPEASTSSSNRFSGYEQFISIRLKRR